MYRPVLERLNQHSGTVKRYFQSLDIQCWQVTGLGRSHPQLCLQAGPEAIEPMLLAVAELEADGAPSRRRLDLLPNNRRGQCSTIQVILSSSSDNLRQMSITRREQTAVLEFTPHGLMQLRDAVSVWAEGGEDFSIHPSGKKEELGEKDKASGELWFWTHRTDP